MCIGASAVIRGALVLTVLSVPHSVTYGQEPKPSPAAASAPDTSFQGRKALTGDWGGTRSEWEEKGVELEFKASQFVQGVASGGVDTGAVGNGKFQTIFKFDFGKLAGWEY